MTQERLLPRAVALEWQDFLEGGGFKSVIIMRDLSPLTPESKARVAFEQTLNIG